MLPVPSQALGGHLNRPVEVEVVETVCNVRQERRLGPWSNPRVLHGDTVLTMEIISRTKMKNPIRWVLRTGSQIQWGRALGRTGIAPTGTDHTLSVSLCNRKMLCRQSLHEKCTRYPPWMYGLSRSHAGTCEYWCSRNWRTLAARGHAPVVSAAPAASVCCSARRSGLDRRLRKRIRDAVTAIATHCACRAGACRPARGKSALQNNGRAARRLRRLHCATVMAARRPTGDRRPAAGEKQYHGFLGRHRTWVPLMMQLDDPARHGVTPA